MLFYEEFNVFEQLYEQEKEYNDKNTIMSQCFSYTLIINNPLLALGLRHKYAADMYNEHQQIIDSLLHYLNEFSEDNGSARYM